MSDQQGPTHLLQKMLVARSKIGYVKKDSYNAGQKFSFASEEAIINEVRSVLNECGIVISESVQRMEIIPVQKDKGTAFLIFFRGCLYVLGCRFRGISYMCECRIGV